MQFVLNRGRIVPICYSFASFIFLLMTGFPAWVLGGIAIIFAGIGYYSDLYLDTMTGLDFLTLGLLVNRLFDMMDNWILVALPMFIFMGIMLDKSGLAERLMQSKQALLGRVRGGLAITVTLIGIILAASTGIIGASVVLLALISLPAMQQQNYHMPTALGTVASAGTLGIVSGCACGGSDGFGSLDNPELLWFVILVALTLQTSFLTPPVGFALFYLKGVCPKGITLQDIYQGVIPFILLQLLALVVVLLWPELVTWLPSVAY